QRMAEYLVLYNSKRPHKSLELMTPVDYILRESKNCNMWWTHTVPSAMRIATASARTVLQALPRQTRRSTGCTRCRRFPVTENSVL
ncbi:IS481 family transposase, partial [Klebsiella pneumoniae]|nr:IS481 family transposase [Klebsiella pneumoniae]